MTLTVDVTITGGPRVQLEAGPGITRIGGPSGVGKTSLLLAIAGVGDRAPGKISLGDQVWQDGRHRLPPERRAVGLVPQGGALFPHLSVLGNVAYGMRGGRARELLAEVGAEDLAERRPRTLSGGEIQRVALARALARGGKVLLLDEPLSALDAPSAAALSEVIVATTRRHGCITLLVTHGDFPAAHAYHLAHR